MDELAGAKATALRDKVLLHREPKEEDAGKKKKKKQPKTERQACGYTGGR